MTTSLSAADQTRQRLFVYNGGFFRQKRLRRIPALKGYDIRVVCRRKAIWSVCGGNNQPRTGVKRSARINAKLLRVEDAFEVCVPRQRW